MPSLTTRQLGSLLKKSILQTLQTAPPAYPTLIARLKSDDGPRRFGLDLSLVDDIHMQELNREYRNQDRTTDVLSFPQWEGDEYFPGGGDGVGGVELGDLVISVPTALRQAGELGHSLERELQFLAIHGTLHLLGYDHITASDRRRMWRWQDQLFGELEQGREVD